jgi:hypothetical protein
VDPYQTGEAGGTSVMYARPSMCSMLNSILAERHRHGECQIDSSLTGAEQKRRHTAEAFV